MRLKFKVAGIKLRQRFWALGDPLQRRIAVFFAGREGVHYPFFLAEYMDAITGKKSKAAVPAFRRDFAGKIAGVKHPPHPFQVNLSL